MPDLITLPRESIYNRLNKAVYKRIEDAYGQAKNRGHEYVCIPHLIASFLTANNEDFAILARHYQLPRDVIETATETCLNALPSSSSVKDLAPEIDLLIERGWVSASLYFSDYCIRSGHLVFAMLNDDHLRRTLRDISDRFATIDLQNFRDNFANILGGSIEQGTQAIDGYGVGTLGKRTDVTSVFISYRRHDRHIVGRMYDRLAERIGREKIFRDIVSIPSGTRDFQASIRRHLVNSSVCLVVIGPAWCSLSDDRGHRRIMSEDDVVRFEVEMALRGAGVVVPVLVDEAKMPTESDLPDSIHPLCTCQAAILRDDPDFDSDVRRLIEHIHQNLDH